MKLTKNELQEAIEKALIEEAISSVFSEEAGAALSDEEFINVVDDSELKKKLAKMIVDPGSKDYIEFVKKRFAKGDFDEKTLAWAVDNFTKEDSDKVHWKDAFRKLEKDLNIDKRRVKGIPSAPGQMVSAAKEDKAKALLRVLRNLKNKKVTKRNIPVIARMLKKLEDFSKEDMDTIFNFLVDKEILAEADMKLIMESYYAIDVDEPLSVKEVAANWNGGEKPYDEAEYHAIYPLDDVLEYRNLDWMEEAETKSPEEYNKVLQNIKELGIIEPIVIQVGINGQAVVADGNHRLAVAQQLNIKEIPVRFEFLQDEVRKANKITLEPGEISTPTEETEKDSYYMR